MKNRNYWDLSTASLSHRPDCSLLLPLHVQLPWQTENFTLSRSAMKDYTSMQAALGSLCTGCHFIYFEECYSSHSHGPHRSEQCRNSIMKGSRAHE